MSTKTYATIKSFVETKLDLQEESFITAAELLTYCEEAVNYCEAEIHKLNIEDQYFVACANIRLVSGQQYYALPSNIYANKILRIVYTDGASIYDVKKITKKARYEDAEVTEQTSGQNSSYRYMLVNNDPNIGTQISLLPKSAETSDQVTPTGNTTSGSKVISGMSSTTGIVAGYYVSGTGIPTGARVQSVDSSTQITITGTASATGTAVTLTINQPRLLVWYIRRANVPVATTDIVDFPEFWNFVAQHMIVECLAKELGNIRLPKEQAKLDDMRAQVLSTLSNMVPDQEDEIEQDLSSYMSQEGLENYGI
jgi:hypothetical protein